MNVALSDTDNLSGRSADHTPGCNRAEHDRSVAGRSLVVIRGILPRSGTNFVADLLRLHPALAVNPGEFWEFAPLRFTPFWNNYVSAIQACKHVPGFDPSRFEPHVGRAWVAYLGESIAKETTHLVVKEPFVDYLPDQYRMFPDSRTIIVVRDARDLIESALRSGFVLPKRQLWQRRHWRRVLPLGDFRVLCRMYVAAAAQLHAFVDERQDLVRSGQVQVIRYEEVVADTRSSVKRLLASLGVSDEQYDWQRLETLPVRGSSFLRGSAGEMDFSQGQPKTPGFQPVGRWAEWSRAKRRVFEREAGASMRRLGYDWHWTAVEAAPNTGHQQTAQR